MKNKTTQIFILYLSFLLLAGGKGNQPRSIGSAPEFLSIFKTTFGSSDLTVRANIAYMTENEGGLHIIDISDPLNPFEISKFSLLRYPGGVAIQGNLLYVASSETNFSGGMLKIINIEDPSNPYEVGSLEIPGGVFRVALNGEVAYVSGITETASVLYVVDIYETSNMSILKIIEAPHGTFFRVIVEDNLAYAAVGGEGLWILDMTNPASPEIIGQFYPSEGSIFDIVKQGDYIYASNHSGLFFWGLSFSKFLAINISDPKSPIEVSSFILWRRVPRGLAILGNSVYVALQNAKEQKSLLAQVFVENPKIPRRIGSVQTGEPTNDIVIQDDLIFLATVNGLEVYRAPSPTLLP